MRFLERSGRLTVNFVLGANFDGFNFSKGANDYAGELSPSGLTPVNIYAFNFMPGRILLLPCDLRASNSVK